jgi:hypothetical protein
LLSPYAHAGLRNFHRDLSSLAPRECRGLLDPQDCNGAGEAHQQDAPSYYGDEVD